MITQSDAYNRGLASGKRARGEIRQRMESTFQGWRAEFPATTDLDFAEELRRLDRERLANPPSIARFPETRGWPDLVAAERQGFLDGCGGGPVELAFRYNSLYFMACRLNTRYVGSGVGADQCTAVFIRDSLEGGPLYGRNCDGGYNPSLDVQPPRRGPDGVRRLWFKGVSCWTYCDEEPQEVFPIEAWRVLPDDCRQLPDVVEFLTRYVEFWWSCNGIIVDEDLNCVAFERSNRRIAWRYSDDGTAAVTSCAHLIPEMHEYREKCLQRSLELRGYHDDNLPDRKYWNGSEARYRRLLQLVREAAQRGPTLKDLAAIMTRHDGPPAERIGRAGESCHPSIPAGAGTWTFRSRVAVLHGPNRRTLYWPIEYPQPCYAKPPYLVLGDGVTMNPAWAKGTRAVPPATGPDDQLEAYRQYEFDYPDTYPQ